MLKSLINDQIKFIIFSKKFNFNPAQTFTFLHLLSKLLHPIKLTFNALEFLTVRNKI